MLEICQKWSKYQQILYTFVGIWSKFVEKLLEIVENWYEFVLKNVHTPQGGREGPPVEISRPILLPNNAPLDYNQT